jgi:hypothetical protein
VVTRVGAGDPDTYFAWGGPGGGTAVDVSADGGTRWWQAYLGSVLMAVVAGGDGRLVALAQNPESVNRFSTGVTWVYISTDDGHHWRYSTRFGAGG